MKRINVRIVTMKEIKITFGESVICMLLYGLIFIGFNIWASIIFSGWWLVGYLIFNFIWFLKFVTYMMNKFYSKQNMFEFKLR